jgi:hypothetical protein
MRFSFKERLKKRRLRTLLNPLDLAGERRRNTAKRASSGA